MSSFYKPISLTIINAGDVALEKLEWSAGLLVYLGVNRKEDAADSDDTWHICKYTYSGEDLIRVEYRRDKAWEDRATLNWMA